MSDVDIGTLTDLARRHLDARAEVVAVRRATVGNSQETWFVDVTGVDALTSLVLRRSAVGGTIDWTDRRVEVDVLRAVAAAGLPVPAVRWWEPDGGTLDRAYLVMDRAPGEPPDLRRPAVCDRLADELGTSLARLHRSVRPPASLPRVDAGAELARWTQRARDSDVAPPVAMALAEWLASCLPEDAARPVLVWGDPGPHNVLADADGRITALLDWELAQLGHPLLDVGAARWSCLGHLDRQRLTAAYESELGAPVDRTTVLWFEVLACLSRSVMLFDGQRAAARHEVHDPNVLALASVMVSANLLRAAELAWGISAADVEDEAHEIVAARRPSLTERADLVGRFLQREVLPAVTDRRVRRQLKIAAALLDPGPGAPEPTAPVTGSTDRRRLVAMLVAERRLEKALLDLYGDTTSID